MTYFKLNTKVRRYILISLFYKSKPLNPISVYLTNVQKVFIWKDHINAIPDFNVEIKCSSLIFSTSFEEGVAFSKYQYYVKISAKSVCGQGG